MFYTLQLQTAFYLVGALLLIFGGFLLAAPQPATQMLHAFPRSRAAGLILLAVAAAWFFYVITYIDLGEFGKWKELMQCITPLAALLTAIYVEEFLSARALGMIVLMAAEPILESAFLKPQLARLSLVSFVYVAIVFAMFWIGMPYVLRDQLKWISATHLRLRAIGALFAGYGVLLLILGLTLRRSV